MDRREIERLLAAIQKARQSGEPIAIATIVRVRGSAYRREGTRMLVRRDGTYECALSGGCLEPSVAKAAEQVIETGESRIVNYDLADDSLWGLGMGCMGAIDVRIERLEDDELSHVWLDVLEQGTAAVLVTPLAGASGRLVVCADGHRVGRLSESDLERLAVDRARLLLLDSTSLSHAEQIKGADLFFEISSPAPELVIFGAGPDAVPVAHLAWTVGFSVTVVDPRAAYLTDEWFPRAARVLAHAGEVSHKVTIPEGASVVVMNHHVERDEASLRHALASGAAYIGVLGPRSRYEKLLASLATAGMAPSAADLARVHNPIGLAIGGETPDEVALSIVGELLAVRRGQAGGFLSGVATSLHAPAATRALTRS